MLGVAVKPTIKEVDGEGRVIKTLVRAGLWEVQTPQVPDQEVITPSLSAIFAWHLPVQCWGQMNLYMHEISQVEFVKLNLEFYKYQKYRSVFV